MGKGRNSREDKAQERAKRKAFMIGVVIGRSYLLKFGRQQASDDNPKTSSRLMIFNPSQLNQKDKDGLSGS